MTVRLLTLLLTVTLASAQQPGTWKKTNFNYTAYASRINDNFFLNADRGWAVNGIGQIHRTTDGGVTWTKQLDKTSKTHFRSVGFFDSLNGYAGALGWGDPNNTGATDTVILYKTTDGGLNWSPEHQLSSKTIERGFCGMHVFNDSVIYGVGRVRGPATFYKTTDRGKSWTAKNMNAYAAGLIDVRFFTKDSGITVGLTDTTHTSSRAIILMTADGGETWDTVHTTPRNNEWAWKITFPSRRTGYVSLQRNSNVAPVYILKTTDGGISWSDRLFSTTGYFVQGLGFLNDTLGWAGGTSLSPKQTTDGGETWTSVTIGNSLNRFRKVNDSVMYVSGAGMWKYSPGTALSVRNGVAVPAGPMLEQNYPNPFNPQTTITFTVPEDGYATISIYDITGAWVRTLAAGEMKKGKATVSWDGRIESDEEAPSGTYFYRLQTKNSTETKKMLLIR
ncbi:MAG: T9SS type A sorting domain-containing protein [Bacteroidetes bacterium]|nr:T9SS type A sorting domain-containing protein [Bacteroidota bacterium]